MVTINPTSIMHVDPLHPTLVGSTHAWSKAQIDLRGALDQGDCAKVEDRIRRINWA